MSQTNYLHNDPEAVEKIQQLIASGEEKSIALALQLIENGGLPPTLFTYVFAVYLFYNRDELAYQAQAILEKQAYDTWEECCLIPTDWHYVAGERIGMNEFSITDYLIKVNALEAINTATLANLVLKFTGWGGAYCLHNKTASNYEILQEIFEDGELSFEDFNLASLPDEIGHFTQTKELVITGNHLSDLPDSIANLTLLETLDFEAEELDKQVIDKLESFFPKLMAKHYYDLSEDAIDDKDFELVLQYANKALNLDATDIEYWLNKGNALGQLHKYAEAYTIFEKCEQMQPHHILALAGKIQTKFFQKEYAQAMKIALYTLSLFDKHPTISRDEEEDIYALKGVIHTCTGEYLQAHEAYDKALSIYAEHDMALYNKACTYALQENKQEMLKYLKECLKYSWDDTFAKQALKDEDFTAYWHDEDFLALVNPNT